MRQFSKLLPDRGLSRIFIYLRDIGHEKQLFRQELDIHLCALNKE